MSAPGLLRLYLIGFVQLPDIPAERCRRWSLLGSSPVFAVTEAARIGTAPIALTLLPGVSGGLLAVVGTALV